MYLIVAKIRAEGSRQKKQQAKDSKVEGIFCTGENMKIYMYRYTCVNMLPFLGLRRQGFGPKALCLKTIEYEIARCLRKSYFAKRATLALWVGCFVFKLQSVYLCCFYHLCPLSPQCVPCIASFWLTFYYLFYFHMGSTCLIL